MASSWTPQEHYIIFSHFLLNDCLSAHIPKMMKDLPGRNYASVERKWIRIMNETAHQNIVRQDYERYKKSLTEAPKIFETWVEDEITRIHEKMDRILGDLKPGKKPDLGAVKELNKEIEILKTELLNQKQQVQVLRQMMAEIREPRAAPHRRY